METKELGAPLVRRLTFSDLLTSLRLGLQDFWASPSLSLFFASFFVVAGMLMAWITYTTGQTFWLVLAVLGFPLVGTLAAVGFYEVSRNRSKGKPVGFGDALKTVWEERGGQLPWLASIIIVIFLFWFFVGHMIFALFLGLTPMTNVSSSLDVFLSAKGIQMLSFGTLVGAFFAIIVFALTVISMPMIIDRDVDFISAMLRSAAAVRANFPLYLLWGAFIAIVTIISMLPFFLGLFISMPILGHATWHLYKRVTDVDQLA